MLLNLSEEMRSNVARYIAERICEEGLLVQVAKRLKSGADADINPEGVNWEALAGCVEPNWSLLESGQVEVSIGVCCPLPGNDFPSPETVSGLLGLGSIDSSQYWDERVCSAWRCTGGQRTLELALPQLVILSDGNIVHCDDLPELFRQLTKMAYHVGAELGGDVATEISADIIRELLQQRAGSPS